MNGRRRIRWHLETPMTFRCLHADAHRRIDRLYRDHAATLQRKLHRQLASADDAMDAVQDVFVDALQHPAQLRAVRHVPAWLRRNASNRASDARRHRQRRPAQSLDAMAERHGTTVDQLAPVAPAPDALDADDRAVVRDQVARAIDRLPAHQRSAAALHHHLGLTTAQISRALGIPLSTAKHRLQQANARLALALRPLARSLGVAG
jgi:RNA polymerase sigma-70 factor (ECF subfamily)